MSEWAFSVYWQVSRVVSRVHTDVHRLVSCAGAWNRVPSEEAGLCMICQYECSSKACKCSFMHKECREEFDADVCSFCGSMYSNYGLEKRPLLDFEEKYHLSTLSKKQRHTKRLKVFEMRKYARVFVPCIRRLFPVRFTTNSDLKFIMHYVASSDAMCNSLYQRLLDKGEKQASATEIVAYVRKLGTSYDLEDSTMLKTLKREFITS